MEKRNKIIALLFIASILALVVPFSIAYSTIKRDINNVTSAVEYLEDIQIINYTLKANGEEIVGVNETKVAITHPELIVTNVRNKNVYVDAPNNWVLVAAIQELQEENDAMKASLCKLGEVQFC